VKFGTGYCRAPFCSRRVLKACLSVSSSNVRPCAPPHHLLRVYPPSTYSFLRFSHFGGIFSCSLIAFEGCITPVMNSNNRGGSYEGFDDGSGGNRDGTYENGDYIASYMAGQDDSGSRSRGYGVAEHGSHSKWHIADLRTTHRFLKLSLTSRHSSFAANDRKPTVVLHTT
jgi:hypothetical protein